MKINKWIQLDHNSLPRENELLIVEVKEGQHLYREAAKYIKCKFYASQVKGTFNFERGTGVHFYKNNTCVVTKYLYVNEL